MKDKNKFLEIIKTCILYSTVDSASTINLAGPIDLELGTVQLIFSIFPNPPILFPMVYQTNQFISNQLKFAPGTGYRIQNIE